MVATRAQEAAQRALLEALAARDTEAVLAALRSPAVGHALAADFTPLHWAAAAGCEGPVLDALVAAGVPVDAPLPCIAGLLAAVPSWPLWQKSLFVLCLHIERLLVLRTMGGTALTLACRKGQLATVRRLLDLGANPNGAVPAAAAEDTGERPLASAVPLASEGAAAANAVVLELLRREADPLASPSVWGQPDAILHGTVLSHASGTPLEEALSPESGVPLLLDHLERQAAAGCLVFRSAGVAVDVMAAAARRRRTRLFCLAHDYAVAAAGLRRVGAPDAGARPAAGRRRAIDSDSDSEEEAAEAGGSAAGGSGGAAEAEGQEGGPGRQHEAEPAGSSAFAAAWRPGSADLTAVLRAAAKGGSADILRRVLASPLPFASARIVRAADDDDAGLLADCAMHAAPEDRGAALALLAGARAQLRLVQLLFVLETRPRGDIVSALLSAAEYQPQVGIGPGNRSVAEVRGQEGHSCPIHRLMAVWQRGPPELAREDPAAWERDVTAALEALLAAGYRPTTYRRLHLIRQPDRTLGVFLPWKNPLDSFPRDTADERRMVLVARQAKWSAEAHECWPPAFKASVRALLLASHRLAQQGGGGSSAPARAAWRDTGSTGSGGATLGCVPDELLVLIAAHAALPMSAWL